jgi:hypothetical protein
MAGLQQGRGRARPCRVDCSVRQDVGLISLSTAFYSGSTQCDAAQRARVPIGKPSHRAPPQWRVPAATGWAWPIYCARRSAALSGGNRQPRPRFGPRECWIPVPFPAPVGSSPNILRHFRDREKAQLPQACADKAWGFAERYGNCSPKAHFSPELESRPFYSTSFFTSDFSGLVSFPSRKIGIPCACPCPPVAPAELLD